MKSTENYEDKQKRQAKLLKEYIKIFQKNNFECTHIYEHGFNVVINGLQDIFIRPFDSTKSYASLTPEPKTFKDIHIDEKFRRKEIGFKADKTPEELFKDINKRLINSDFCIEQFNELTAALRRHNEYVSARDSIKNEILKINLDLRLSEQNEEFSLYLENGYGKVKYYRDSVTLELSSISTETAIKILKLLEKSETKKDA